MKGSIANKAEADFLSFHATMMDNSKMSLQKELQNVVNPSLKAPGIPASYDTTLHPPPPSLQPSKHKFLSSIQPSSANSSTQSLEPPSEVSNLNHKNQHLQIRKSMSLSSSQGRTHAVIPDEFDLKLSALEHDNMHQVRFFKTQANIKDGPNDGLFKWSALCMCLPGFGKSKAKPVKERKGENEMDHSVSHVMSSTFSFEKFEHDSGVTQDIITHDNHGDESISSYFELPSQVFKCSGDDGAQSPVTATFLLDQDFKGDQL